jgi:hypothetical protein
MDIKNPEMSINDNKIKFPRISKYTLEILKERTKIVHGDKYDISSVKTEDVQNGKSKINVKCNKCLHLWTPAITNFINRGSGCPKCKGHLKWTFDEFIKRSKEIHGDDINYINIKPQDIQNCNSRILLICKKCEYEWECSVRSNINEKSGCPNCCGHVKLTYDTFIKRAKEIHGDTINYSFVNENDDFSTDNHITLKCNICSYVWSTTINNHINCKTGCSECNKGMSWNLSRFLSETKDIHRDMYNYDNIKSEDIKSKNSKVSVICRKCSTNWIVSVFNHIYHKTGCPNCRSSKLEKFIKLF